MTRLAAAVILLPLASFAAGNAPGPATEGPYVQWIEVVDTFGPVDLFGQRTLWPGWVCGINTDCGDWHERTPDPAPVPLPAPILLLTAAIAALILKGNAMPKFRKKPVVIDAFQMTVERGDDNTDWPEWLGAAWQMPRGLGGALQLVHLNPQAPRVFELVTREGAHRVSWGDWIIQGVNGELYPCKPDIFEKTYEPA